MQPKSCPEDYIRTNVDTNVVVERKIWRLLFCHAENLKHHLSMAPAAKPGMISLLHPMSWSGQLYRYQVLPQPRVPHGGSQLNWLQNRVHVLTVAPQGGAL